MSERSNTPTHSAFFITFSGNCKEALLHYQRCFGGRVHFESLAESLDGMTHRPVLSGALIADKLTLYGSDLVHNEGRRPGNALSIYVHCENARIRSAYIRKLLHQAAPKAQESYPIIEITDPYQIRWLFGV